MNKKKCFVESCQKFHYAKGYCKGHYEQVSKHGRIIREELSEHGKLKPGDEERIMEILKETTLTHQEVGSIFGVSRGPIYKINKKHGIRNKETRGSIVQQKICPWCGEIYRPYSNFLTRPNAGKYCSRKCYNTWQRSEGNRGENSPAWIDGGKHESESNRLRKTEEWENWRTSVYERDDYICFICQRRGGKLHPHHIKKKSLYPELVFDINNGITLCEDCHHLEGIHIAGGALEKVLEGAILGMIKSQLYPLR